MFTHHSNAQSSSSIKSKQKDTARFELIKSIPGKFSYFNTDLFNNIYAVDSKNQLKKINEKGDSVASYNDVKRFGAVSYIDVSNPFKILLFYKDYRYLVTLDQLLTFRNSISLRSKDFFNVKAVATSYDNNYWIFDERDFKLKKIDDAGRVVSESGDLRMITEETPLPQTITESNNQLYLYDENKGVYVFDYYGSMKNKIPFLKWKNVSVYNNKLIGFDGEALYSYEFNSLNLQEYLLPKFITGYKSIKLSGNRLFVLKDDGIFIYQIQ
jgi:hypothetical protein